MLKAIDIIEDKKRGKQLSKEQIKFMINGYLKKEIPSYQFSSFLMSIFFKGMNFDETYTLTMAMVNSGEVLDLSTINGTIVDKHSTGGIGDKVSIIISPILASLGLNVAKMSGKGLGFTGGTLDKLESIKGFNVSLDQDSFLKQVNDIHIAIISQTKNIVPSDKQIYALRDVTGTIDSIPLISSSIMSKKLATGSDNILLDVKVGNGAFMKDIESASNLAKYMVEIGKKAGKNVKVEMTSMDSPLGRSIGNKIEILECIDFLKGKKTSKDLEEVVYSSVNILLKQSKIIKNEEEGNELIKKCIQNNKALNKFKEWIKYQNGDLDLLFSEKFFKPKYKFELKSEKEGYLNIKSAVEFGIAAMNLGAGRKTKEDCIDYDAGIFLNKKENEKIKKGDVLFTFYSNKKIDMQIIEKLKKYYTIENKKIYKKLILGKI